jgi:hypothetical protein
MLKIIRIITISLATTYLSACMIDGTSRLSSFSPYNYSDTPMVYPDSYDMYGSSQQNYNTQPEPSREVVVPNSYHVGQGSPESSKNLDRTWVNSQNPQSYTIEIARDRKPSTVARALYKVPKSERSAEVKTTNGNYKGLYGSYPTYEAAQEKLNSLPDNVKQGAGIKSWGNVQSDVGG